MVRTQNFWMTWRVLYHCAKTTAIHSPSDVITILDGSTYTRLKVFSQLKILSNLNKIVKTLSGPVLPPRSNWSPFLYQVLFYSVDVTNVWGHVNMYAKGAGQAVAQLDLTYGIDYEPFKVTLIEKKLC